jgi:hemoglobin
MSAPASVYDSLGGEDALRHLVDRFYDLMDLEPQYAVLREAHFASLDNARDKLFWFLSGFLGGPNHYIDRFGHPMLRARHLPIKIGVSQRDQWLACMQQAIDDEKIGAEVAQALMKSLQGTADWMRNQQEI